MRSRILVPVFCALALTLGGPLGAADESGSAPPRADDSSDPTEGCDPLAGAAVDEPGQQPVLMSQVKVQEKAADPPKAGKTYQMQRMEEKAAPTAAKWGRVQGDTVRLNPGYVAKPKGKGAATVMMIGGGGGPGGASTSIVLDVFCKCVTGDKTTDDAPGCILGVYKDGTIRCAKEGGGCGGQCKADTRPPPKVQIQ